LVQCAGHAPLIVAVGEQASETRVAALEKAGAQVWRLGAPEGRIALAELLAALYRREWCSVLVEGGAAVAGAFLGAGLVDKAAFFVAPLLVGQGTSALGPFAVEDLGMAPRLRDVRNETLGDDVLITGYLNDLVTRFMACSAE